MSIASAIANKQQQVADCYMAISNKGGTLPATQDVANMPTAINSISTGGTIDSLTITPSTSSQTITASGGVDGYSPITVNAVTSSIDANIQASNIKSGITILGVTGDYGGGGSKYGCTIDNIIGNTDANGVLQDPSGSVALDFSGVTDLAANALYYRFAYNPTIVSATFGDLIRVSASGGARNAFYSCGNLVSVDLSKLKEVTNNSACNYMCGYCYALTTADLSSLETVSLSSGCSQMFYGDLELVNIDLSKLKTVSGALGCYYMLYGCYKLPATFNLSGLEEISGNNGCAQMLENPSNQAGLITSFSFDKLKILAGSQALYRCFRYRTALQHLYFPALQTNSFGNYVNQLQDIIQNITGCTIHFPSNLSSTIAGLTGYPNFGGTNTVLAFDLTATS